MQIKPAVIIEAAYMLGDTCDDALVSVDEGVVVITTLHPVLILDGTSVSVEFRREEWEAIVKMAATEHGRIDAIPRVEAAG